MAAALAAGMMAEGSALAQGAPVSDADRATARSLLDEGHAAFDKKDYVTARDRFARADSIVHAPSVLLWLARSDIALGKWVAAQETLARIGREGVTPGAPPAFGRAVADAAKELEALRPRVPAVVVQVDGAAGARVTVDGAEIPAAAIGVRRPADPGEHLIRVEAPGFEAVERRVILAEGKVETVVIEPKVRKAEPAPAPLPLPPPLPPAPAGREPAAPPPAPPEPPPSSTQRTLGIVAVSLGGAGLVAGGVTGGLALEKHGFLSTHCPKGTCDGQVKQGDLDAFHTLGAASTAGLVAGGALAAGGLVLLATAPRSGTRVGLSPVVSPGYVGVKGSF